MVIKIFKKIKNRIKWVFKKIFKKINFFLLDIFQKNKKLNKNYKGKQKILSICIPTYEMGGVGHIFLEHSLKIIKKQTLKNFEVIISDYSKNDKIKKICKKYKKFLNINYYKNYNKKIGASTNINNAISKANGKLIKILFQDDFLFNEKSLEIIVNNFDLNKDGWLVTACEHSTDGKKFVRPFYPKFHQDIHLGKNTIGSPSILTIKNNNPLLFDTKLTWLLDCDYYKRLYYKYGEPKILNKICSVIRTGDHQLTNTSATKSLRNDEFLYIKNKYKMVILKNVTLVAVAGVKPRLAVKALRKSMENIEYGKILLISHKKPLGMNKKIKFVKCQSDELISKDPTNKNDYSKFMAYQLHKYIDTEFVLIVHNDGYVLRYYKWDDVFLNYDYIGAPWPKDKHFTKSNKNARVGNGGFSLRSKKLLNILNELNLPFTDNQTGYYNEDGVICVYHRDELEKNGIKFAPVEIASRFSHEHACEDSSLEPFGFHKYKK